VSGGQRDQTLEMCGIETVSRSILAPPERPRGMSPAHQGSAVVRRAGNDCRARCFEFMDRASDYRHQADHARKLAEATWQLDLEDMLRHLAQDLDEIADDLEARATEIRHEKGVANQLVIR
jgi:hypothetical protein